jgi:hypothetical protein
MALPNTFCIGAPKSGTTSLHTYLSANPNVCGSNPKEPWYFSDYHNRGLAWYESCFAHNPNAKAIIDFSTTYSQYPHFDGIPKKLWEAVPEAKFIYIVRDPLDRAISQYYFHRQLYKPATFEEAIRDEAIIEPGLYYMQIERYLEYFPLSRFLFLTTSELSANPDATCQKVCGFLGVPHVPGNYHDRHNVTMRCQTLECVSVDRLAEMKATFAADSKKFGNMAGIDVTPWLNSPKYNVRLVQD